MTTTDKFLTLRSVGVKWGEICSFLGVSRQFISQVRAGHKKLSAAKEAALDQMVANLDSNLNRNIMHPSQAMPRRDNPGLDARLDGIEARLSEIERAVIRLVNSVENGRNE